MEAVADGPAVPRALGRLHEGQGGDVFRTNIPEAPWHIVEGDDKKRARLNCIAHLLDQIPYEDIPHEEIELPERVFNPNYERRVLPDELYVPERY